MMDRQRVRSILGNRVRRNRVRIGSAAGVAVALGAILIALGPLSWLVAGDAVRALHGKERADALNAVRQTVLAAMAGTMVLLGLVFTAISRAASPLDGVDRDWHLAAPPWRGLCRRTSPQRRKAAPARAVTQAIWGLRGMPRNQAAGSLLSRYGIRLRR